MALSTVSVVHVACGMGEIGWWLGSRFVSISFQDSNMIHMRGFNHHIDLGNTSWGTSWQTHFLCLCNNIWEPRTNKWVHNINWLKARGGITNVSITNVRWHTKFGLHTFKEKTTSPKIARSVLVSVTDATIQKAFVIGFGNHVAGVREVNAYD